MRLDLNDYYPSSNLARLYRRRNRKGDDDKARISASITVVACERARARNSDDEWLNPTLLGAAFDAGDVEKAQEFADQVSQDGPRPGNSIPRLTIAERPHRCARSLAALNFWILWPNWKRSRAAKPNS